MPTETNRDMRAKPETIGRMPRTPDGLSDDAWRDSTAEIASAYPQYHAEYEQAREMQRNMPTDMPAPPVQWQTTPDRDWFSWRDWEWSDLWAVAFVGVVLACGLHIAGLWG